MRKNRSTRWRQDQDRRRVKMKQTKVELSFSLFIPADPYIRIALGPERKQMGMPSERGYYRTRKGRCDVDLGLYAFQYRV